MRSTLSGAKSAAIGDGKEKMRTSEGQRKRPAATKRSPNAAAKTKNTLGMKSEATRERIVDAAAKIFAQRGYAHTRLADIAKAAKFHAGGIYYYFDSREALVEEVLLRSTRRSVHAVNAAVNALPENASTEERLRAATIAQVREVLSQNYYTAAFNKIYPQVPEAVRERHRAAMREYFDIWRKIVRKGQLASEVRTDVDLAVMRLTIAGAIQWSIEWANPTESTPELLGEQMAKLFYSGIAQREGR